MGSKYYNNEKGELCEYGVDDVEPEVEDEPEAEENEEDDE